MSAGDRPRRLPRTAPKATTARIPTAMRIHAQAARPPLPPASEAGAATAGDELLTGRALGCEDGVVDGGGDVVLGATGAVRVNATVPVIVSPSSAVTLYLIEYPPAGPAGVTGAVMTAPAADAFPTAQAVPSGPWTVIGSAGRPTASLNVSSICVGAAASEAPFAGLLLLSEVCADAGAAVVTSATPASSSAADKRRKVILDPIVVS